MSATTEPTQRTLEATRADVHARCVVCGRSGPGALAAHFRLLPDGRVTADCEPRQDFEGYADVLHGGVVSALLDGAMTNCLFAHGVVAVTAELNVRFRHPVRAGETVRVEAGIERTSPPLYVVAAKLHQTDRCCATATGKFMQKPEAG